MMPVYAKTLLFARQPASPLVLGLLDDIGIRAIREGRITARKDE
jgi:hypothetical protein